MPAPLDDYFSQSFFSVLSFLFVLSIFFDSKRRYAMHRKRRKWRIIVEEGCRDVEQRRTEVVDELVVVSLVMVNYLGVASNVCEVMDERE